LSLVKNVFPICTVVSAAVSRAAVRMLYVLVGLIAAAPPVRGDI